MPQSKRQKAMMTKLKKGDRVLANFTGGLEEGKITSILNIGKQKVFNIQSISRPNQKVSSLRRDFKDARTGN